MKILIVEDEEKLARFTELELMHEGYETEKVFDGRLGLELAESGRFDLVLLDIMLPGLNGIEVLRRLRKSSDVPVILLTARDSVMDKVSGLDTGADDYITKPFDIEELLARIRAALRKRKADTVSSTLSSGLLTLDDASHTVKYDGNEIEGDFLYGMLSNTKRVGGFDLKIKEPISISDGLMELILIRNPDKPVDSAKMLSAVLTQDTSSEFITFVQAKNITFHTDLPMPWTVDGEPGGNLTEGKVEIIEHALELYI